MPHEKTFISYSRSDAEFALRLAKDLRAAQVDVWIDQLDIRAGDMWDQAVEVALRESANVLVVLSPAAVGSRSVMDEVAFALEENKRVLPVRYRECAIPFRLRRVQFTDFTSSYDDGLRRLVGGVADYEPDSQQSEAVPSRSEEGQPSADRTKQGSVAKVNPRQWLARHPRVRTATFASSTSVLLSVIAVGVSVPPHSEWRVIGIIVVASWLVSAVAGAIAGSEHIPRVFASGMAVAAFTTWAVAVTWLLEMPIPNALAGASVEATPLGAVLGAILGRTFSYVRQRRLRTLA